MRRRLISIPILFAVVSMPVIALQGTHELVGPVNVLWETRHGPAEAVGMAVSPDGSRVFVLGEMYDRYETSAYDGETGVEIWSVHFDRSYYDDGPTTIAVSPDGTRVVVAGWSLLYPWYGWLRASVVCYDADTGTYSWFRSSSYEMTPVATTFARDSQTIYTVLRWPSWEAEIWALDASSGDTVWAHTSDAVFQPFDVELGPDGTTLFVTGDRGLEAYNSTTGARLWSKTVHDRGVALAVSPDNTILFRAGTTGWPNIKWNVGAYDPLTGRELWTATYDDASVQHEALDVVVSPDGTRLFVTGYSRGGGANDDYLTIAYDAATGEEIWSAIEDGPASGIDRAWSMAVAPDGDAVFVTGLLAGVGSEHDYGTFAYDAADGEIRWLARYDGPYSDTDVAEQIQVASDGGTVFVTGNSYGWFDKIATVAYELPVEVVIDIKPGGYPNPINPRSNGLTPVAILGSEDFDVTSIDVTTLAFGAWGRAPHHDLTDTWTYNEHLEDVNLDGFTDLVSHYRTRYIGIMCGDTEVTLTGELLNGRSFAGTDEIVTVGCPPPERAKPVADPETMTETAATESGVFGKDD